MVLFIKNSLGLEFSRRELIFSWLVWLVVPSIRYMGSSEMEQNITLVIISGTRVAFQST